MGQQSKIRTLRQVDDPVQLTASYRLNAIDRALIDEEIRATQLHVVQSLISGLVATWAILDSGSAPVTPGCVVASASSVLGTVKLASTLTVLGQAGQGAGIVLASASPGSPVWIAVAGIILQSAGITGLAVGSPGPVKIDGGTILVGGSGRLVQVAGYGGGDYPAGYVDNAGNFTIGFLQIGVAGADAAHHNWVDNQLDGGATLTLTGQQNMLVDASAFTANRSMKLPASPLLNQCVTFKFTDASLASFKATIDGNGTQVQGGTSDAAATFDMTGALYGNKYGSATFCFNGTIWETI